MFRTILALIFVICCWKWGDWRNWQKYYQTILYFILLDFLYNMLFANYPLWKYSPDHTLNDIFVAFVIFPCTVLLFLPSYPNKFFKQILYVLFWVIVYVSIEYTAFALGNFKYFNGWNLRCSAVFDVALFLTLILHHKKPVIAWFFTVAGIIITAILTNLPINNLK